ncbi:MAG: hypothetical protein E5X89_07820 [Mesorhizobium sp.]|nr:MAG: hypothetical protein E5X88_20355 [Mesorhizobium sp.]TIO35958.1 MAG: hypothetical protein E5X89_07820 [Mesorhizobium sp.]TIP07714.1 MAG: hypothetical protein E5X73_35625 [Mesorhizobium sp.]
MQTYKGGSKGEAAWTLNTKSSSARPTPIWWTKDGRSSRPAGLIGRVKHLRGEENLRHASLQDFREED